MTAPSQLSTLGQLVTQTQKNFLHQGTGAVSRTALSKLQDTLSLSDFDNFLDAATEAAALGRILLITGGTVSIPANTIIPANTRIQGIRGKTALTISGSGSLIAGGTGISIKELTISGGTSGFITNGFGSNSIENCDFINQTSHGLVCDSDHNLFSGNTFTSCGASGVSLTGSGAFNNDLVRNTFTSCVNFGIWVNAGANRNLLEGNKTLVNGLELIGVTYNCWENRILNNHAEGTGDNGISVTGYRNTIIGNNCSKNTNHGIGLYGERNQCVG